MMRRFLKGLVPFLCVVGLSETASAQEIQVTGPLAGAPAVRNLRQHRKQRFELAPAISFTLLDEYQRTIFAGVKANYNVTDWLGLGVWGAFGAVKVTTGLTDKIQTNTDSKFDPKNPDYTTGAAATGRRLTALNIGQDFKAQLGTMNFVIAPQITAVPFRGKLSIFEKIFVDTDAYFFAGPAFVNVTERKACGTGGVDCSTRNNGPGGPGTGTVQTKETESRFAIAPTFGLGLNFYTGRWTSFGLEWRGLPFSWNTGGFDTHGGGPDAKFPDNKVDDKDREFKFNQMITISFGMYFPTELKSSE
jgi:hypothetical protein